MESNIKLKTTSERMEELMDDGPFMIKYYEMIKENEKANTYKVMVRHADEIGEQKGTFDYKKFIETFDRADIREKYNLDTYLLNKDIEMAKKGLEGGLSAETVMKVLKIYGSGRCEKEAYVKLVMKSEEIQKLIKKIKRNAKKMAITR